MAGTIIKPPPTPNKPAIKPVSKPALSNMGRKSNSAETRSLFMRQKKQVKKKTITI